MRENVRSWEPPSLHGLLNGEGKKKQKEREREYDNLWMIKLETKKRREEKLSNSSNGGKFLRNKNGEKPPIKDGGNTSSEK